MNPKDKPLSQRHSYVFGLRLEYQEKLKQLAEKHNVPRDTMVELLIEQAAQREREVERG